MGLLDKLNEQEKKNQTAVIENEVEPKAEAEAGTEEAVAKSEENESPKPEAEAKKEEVKAEEKKGPALKTQQKSGGVKLKAPQKNAPKLKKPAAASKEEAKKEQPAAEAKEAKESESNKAKDEAKKPAVNGAKLKKAPAAKKINVNSKKPASSVKAQEMQKLIDKKKEDAKQPVCEKKKALHAHLQEVGEDGLTQRERIDKELKEQTARLRKILWISCPLMILLFAGILIGPRMCKRMHDKKNNTVMKMSGKQAFLSLKSRINNMVQSGKADVEKIREMVKEHLEIYPDTQDQVDAYKKKLKMYNIEL